MVQDQDERLVEDKDARLEELNVLYEAMHRIIEERAVAYADDPIGRLGLHSLRYRIRGSRDRPVLVEEWCMDHRLLRALLKIEKRATTQFGKEREDAEKARATLEEMKCRLEAGRQRVVREREQRDHPDES
jgi:hypothetical protein